MSTVHIEAVCKRLLDASVSGIDLFRHKLKNNWKCEAVREALLLEAKSALMFTAADCQVRMRESPDLEVAFGGSIFFAEVKHFRRKLQDDLDDERLSKATGLLVPYGDTVPTEGSNPWEQVMAVASKKTPQYRPNVSNVLLINSSSANCIDDAIVPTAIDMIDALCQRQPEHELRKLNGIVLVAEEINLRRERNVHFFKTMFPATPLPEDVRVMLADIRFW